MQQQLIDAQQAALRELSTPLIPIADRVLVIPLIGAIDHQRSQQILETLLEGIGKYQADTAIIDITGVRVLDTQTANGLIRAAQAVRLLGAQVIITGVSPEVAQTIVHLGVSMEMLVTYSNLQTGITHALKRRR
jgi:rsbT co-antagonist protein RsbR